MTINSPHNTSLSTTITSLSITFIGTLLFDHTQLIYFTPPNQHDKNTIIKISNYNMDLYNYSTTLNDTDGLYNLLYKTATKINTTIITKNKVHFQPHKITTILILTESHLLITT